MWWEYSEFCGYVERARAPAFCCEFGKSGVIFGPDEVDGALTREAEANSLRAVWLQAGFEQARVALGA
jgi:hypothetical protein